MNEHSKDICILLFCEMKKTYERLDRSLENNAQQFRRHPPPRAPAPCCVGASSSVDVKFFSLVKVWYFETHLTTGGDLHEKIAGFDIFVNWGENQSLLV